MYTLSRGQSTLRNRFSLHYVFFLIFHIFPTILSQEAYTEPQGTIQNCTKLYNTKQSLVSDCEAVCLFVNLAVVGMLTHLKIINFQSSPKHTGQSYLWKQQSSSTSCSSWSRTCSSWSWSGSLCSTLNN